MPALLAAAGIGAAVGAIAGLAVYGARAAFSDEVSFHWKDALAATAGGVVGGATFPFVMAGLGAVGVPALASYVAAGGLAWGGIWTLAQDGASVLLGRTERLGGVGRYVKATAIGLAVSAALVPAARLVIRPNGILAPRPSTPAAFIGGAEARATTANLVKSEAEFLAFGAANETIGAVVEASALALNAGSVSSANELVNDPAPATLPAPAPAPAPAPVAAAPEPSTRPTRAARGFASVLEDESR